MNHQQKADLLGNASATLFPITWSEPFGLVMAESMVVGTPVIAMNMGSVSEVIANGVSGYVCQSYEEMAKMIPKALQLNRQKCREHVENNFSVKHMVDGYEAVYEKIVGERNFRNWFNTALRTSLESITSFTR
jgi:glycosyltransferase involved in cell wall biosynthesis